MRKCILWFYIPLLLFGAFGCRPSLDDQKSITSFSFSEQGSIGNILEETHSIAVSVPYGTDAGALVPTITYAGTSLSPASGVACDFSSDVVYTVTAADGTAQEYVVTVEIESIPRDAKSITAFSFGDPSIGTSINEATHEIFLIIPYGKDVTSLAPSINYSGASVSPPSGLERDFSAPMVYTVSATDGTTQEYLVSCKKTKLYSFKYEIPWELGDESFILCQGKYDRLNPEESAAYCETSIPYKGEHVETAIEIAMIVDEPLNIWLRARDYIAVCKDGGEFEIPKLGDYVEGNPGIYGFIDEYAFDSSQVYSLACSYGYSGSTLVWFQLRIDHPQGTDPLDWDIGNSDERTFGSLNTSKDGNLVVPEVHVWNSAYWALESNGAAIAHDVIDGGEEAISGILRLSYSGTNEIGRLCFIMMLRNEDGSVRHTMAVEGSNPIPVESGFGLMAVRGRADWASPASPTVRVMLREAIDSLGMDFSDIKRIDLVERHGDPYAFHESLPYELKDSFQKEPAFFIQNALGKGHFFDCSSFIFADSNGLEYYWTSPELWYWNTTSSSWERTGRGDVGRQLQYRDLLPNDNNPNFTEDYTPSAFSFGWWYRAP